MSLFIVFMFLQAHASDEPIDPVDKCELHPQWASCQPPQPGTEVWEEDSKTGRIRKVTIPAPLTFAEENALRAELQAIPADDE